MNPLAYWSGSPPRTTLVRVARRESPNATSAADQGVDDRPRPPPTRVALVGLSRLVDDIVTRLLEGSDEPFEICARLPAAEDILGEFRRSRAHVLLCMLPEDRMTAHWERTIDQLPPLTVVNLFDQERSARLYTLRPTTLDVSQVDANALIKLLADAKAHSE